MAYRKRRTRRGRRRMIRGRRRRFKFRQPRKRTRYYEVSRGGVRL